MSTCRACSAPILFVKMTTTGKPMPVDPNPDTNGNIAAHPAGVKKYTRGRYCRLTEPLQPGETRLMAHWYTCNDPRKPGRPRRRPPDPAPPLPGLDTVDSEPPAPF